jgi:alpha-tubulin suppressor-like RCC1 family protein
MGTISATVPAGSFFAATQEEANALALAEACAQVAELRAASPCEGEPPGEEQYSLWSWGRNDDGQLGVGELVDKFTPTFVSESTPELAWATIAGGRWHSAGIKADGSFWTWGEGLSGELGNGIGAFNREMFPVQIDAGPWLDVKCGQGWTLALKADGTIWGVGENGYGNLGQGDNTDRSTLVQLGSATNWTQIACTQEGTTYAINDLGELWGCGKANEGELGSDYFPGSQSTLVRIGADTWIHVAGGTTHVAAVRSDGTMWHSGDNTNPAYPGYHQMGTDSDWVSSAAGAGCTISKKSDGSLWGVGANAAGQLGQGHTTTLTSYAQIGSDTDWDKYVIGIGGGAHVLAIKTNKELYGWGYNMEGTLGLGIETGVEDDPIQLRPGDTHWIGIGAGMHSSFGLRDTVDEPPPPTGTDGVAFGGVLSVVGGYNIHRFDGSATFNVISGSGVLFDFLLVGAGGGGAFGGGGAGELVYQTGVTLADGAYPVVIGAKGLGAGGSARGQDGGASTFNGNTAAGGGGGGANDFTSNRDGRAGASGGGGGGHLTDSTVGVGGAATAGNDGGSGSSTPAGVDPGGSGAGGGGGAGAVGADGSSSSTTGVGGEGGAGTANSITGVSAIYAAGGGGGGTTAGGAGGSSGRGGIGATGLVFGGNGTAPGCGGGGSRNVGGEGHPGVFIIRYLSPA